MAYRQKIADRVYLFPSLPALLAKASPFRSGDALAGLTAGSNEERVAAQFALADCPLKDFLNDVFVPYEKDEVTRLILDEHDAEGFARISHFTVGDLRNWLLSDQADSSSILNISRALTPEMVAAVSKLMRNQDLINVASRIELVTRFRNTIGLKGHFSVRLQPNHPTDDPAGIAASMIDGLLYGCGDAVIGINPASDDPVTTHRLLDMIDQLRMKFDMPIQSCVLSHVTTSIQLIKAGAPVDLVFQSIGGTEMANRSFGISLTLLKEASAAALELHRGTIGNNLMYFETGQGAALSANANAGLDQQTCETRAYAVARYFNPLLVNSVVGFIGPEYLFDGKQIIRAALEDHCCGKLMGLPMGVDVCYTNHAAADQDDMDNLLTLLAVAGCNFVMGVPGADDIMLNYQSTSFHDAAFIRRQLGLRPAPEFEEWLIRQGIMNEKKELLQISTDHALMFAYE